MCLFVPRCLLFWVTAAARLPVLTELEREWTHTTSSPRSALVTKGGSACHPEFCPRAWLTSRAGGEGVGGVGGRGAVGGSVYLRKYQASSTKMSSSRDRTSTVRMMWWVGNVTSSKEEGEAEPMGRQRSRKNGGQGHRHTAHVKNAWASKKKNSHPLSSVLAASI